MGVAIAGNKISGSRPFFILIVGSVFIGQHALVQDAGKPGRMSSQRLPSAGPASAHPWVANSPILVVPLRMVIGDKIKAIRESKKLSQGDIERRTGLLRCYTSRVENGHTVPSVETLEKYARALEIPLYQFFHDGKAPIEKPNVREIGNGKPLSTKGEQELHRFARAISRMDDRNRKLLLALARGFSKRSPK